MTVIKKKNGSAILIFVFMLAALIGSLIYTLGGQYQSLNSSTKNVNVGNDVFGAVADLAQVVYGAYMAAQAGGGPPPTCPVNSYGTSVAQQVLGVSSGSQPFWVCLPSPNSNVCSSLNFHYCLATNPYVISQTDKTPDYVVRLKKPSGKSFSSFILKDLINLAHAAAAPEPWLPVLAAEPVLNVVMPNCTGNNALCVQCSDANTHCMTFRVCTDGTTNCNTATTPPNFITPTVAFQ